MPARSLLSSVAGILVVYVTAPSAKVADSLPTVLVESQTAWQLPWLPRNYLLVTTSLFCLHGLAASPLLPCRHPGCVCDCTQCRSDRQLCRLWLPFACLLVTLSMFCLHARSFPPIFRCRHPGCVCDGAQCRGGRQLGDCVGGEPDSLTSAVATMQLFACDHIFGLPAWARCFPSAPLQASWLCM
jgi:hypothetical protein